MKIDRYTQTHIRNRYYYYNDYWYCSYYYYCLWGHRVFAHTYTAWHVYHNEIGGVCRQMCNGLIKVNSIKKFT